MNTLELSYYDFNTAILFSAIALQILAMNMISIRRRITSFVFMVVSIVMCHIFTKSLKSESQKAITAEVRSNLIEIIDVGHTAWRKGLPKMGAIPQATPGKVIKSPK